jgi:hypothetical protein
MTDGAAARGLRTPAVAVGVLLRIAIAGVLLLAGGLKLRAPAAFAAEIANYQLVPALAPYLGATLPAIEVVIGLGLLVLSAPWRRAAAAAAVALFAVFTVAVGSAYARQINVACGCFGGSGGSITALTIARDLALLAGAVLLLVLPASVGARRRP